LSYEAGALADPISVGLHAMRKGEMLPGKKVGIFGAGPIGLSILQVARASGASLIAASEVSQIRRDFAQKCGANLILNPGEQKNISELILEATEGDGLDIAFECAGVAPSLMDAIRSTRKGGIIVVVSAFEKPVSLNLLETWFTEKRIDFCFGYKNDFSGALALMADRRVNGEVMITKKISLTDLVAEGFEELILNSEKNIKIMVYPN
jgi:(R,R)-butanediol dehydrogenase/meso-butanediol dehydrogenase/diacetyl reductase